MRRRRRSPASNDYHNGSRGVFDPFVVNSERNNNGAEEGTQLYCQFIMDRDSIESLKSQVNEFEKHSSEPIRRQASPLRAFYSQERGSGFLRSPFVQPQVVPVTTSTHDYICAPPQASNRMESNYFSSARPPPSQPSPIRYAFNSKPKDSAWYRSLPSSNDDISFLERIGSPNLQFHSGISTHQGGQHSTTVSPVRKSRQKCFNRNASFDSTESFSSFQSLSGISPIRRSSMISSRISNYEKKSAARDSPSPPELIPESDEPVNFVFDRRYAKLGKCMSSDTFNVNEEENEDEKTSKSPLPQNLRGDPFRSAKVKTELCRHFRSEKGCPFGDKCNYAHGEHELKYTKLIDLEKAGLIDVEIFRTHACPTWVATGSCPFDQRCTGLHDPRVVGPSHLVSWLPHAETLVNSVGTGVNVDKFYHQQVSAVYSCSPIYGYVPPAKWKEDNVATQFTWNDYYAYVSNLDRRSFSGSFYNLGSLVKSYNEHNMLSDLYRYLIILKMRERKLGQSYAYLPSHLLYGELCMVLQNRSFCIVDERSDEQGPYLLEANAYDTSSPSQVKNKFNDKETVIEAHEIAFGPVGDPGVQQVSIWFDLTSADIIPCTPQQAKRHKRSRHRLKKSKQAENHLSTDSAVTNKRILTSGNADDSNGTSIMISTRQFYNYQPIDNPTFDLLTDILSHRAHLLCIMSRRCALKKKMSTINVLKLYELRMITTFRSLRRHWMTWYWPVNVGRGTLDANTDVPFVNEEYCFTIEGIDAVHLHAFHGHDDKPGPEVVSNKSKLATSFIWKSFVYNMQLSNTEAHDDSFLFDVKSANMRKHGSHYQMKKFTEVAFSKLRRLPVLRSLSLGHFFGSKRVLPKLPRVKANELNDDISNTKSCAATVYSLLNEWNTVKDHFQKNHNSPLRNSRRGNDINNSKSGSASELLPSCVETGVCDALDEASKSWRRMPEKYMLRESKLSVTKYDMHRDRFLRYETT